MGGGSGCGLLYNTTVWEGEEGNCLCKHYNNRLLSMISICLKTYTHSFVLNMWSRFQVRLESFEFIFC